MREVGSPHASSGISLSPSSPLTVRSLSLSLCDSMINAIYGITELVWRLFMVRVPFPQINRLHSLPWRIWKPHSSSNSSHASPHLSFNQMKIIMFDICGTAIVSETAIRFKQAKANHHRHRHHRVVHAKLPKSSNRMFNSPYLHLSQRFNKAPPHRHRAESMHTSIGDDGIWHSENSSRRTVPVIQLSSVRATARKRVAQTSLVNRSCRHWRTKAKGKKEKQEKTIFILVWNFSSPVTDHPNERQISVKFIDCIEKSIGNSCGNWCALTCSVLCI